MPGMAAVGCCRRHLSSDAGQAMSFDSGNTAVGATFSQTFSQAGTFKYHCTIHAAMTGQSVRFTRQDTVEEQWRIMQPLIDAPPPVHPYVPGSWGPDAAGTLMTGHGRWHEPWIVA